MIKTIAALMAAATMFVGVAADARTNCSCAPKKHRTAHHHRIKHRAVKRVTVVRPVETVVVEPAAVITRATVEAETYVSAETAYLPDPWRPGREPWVASTSENLIAEALNASLDTWRSCGWGGYEEPSAAFVAWSRTHVTPDPKDPAHIQIAWKPYSRASFERTESLTDPIERSRYCTEVRPDRTQMRADMDRQMDALAKAHLSSHRH